MNEMLQEQFNETVFAAEKRLLKSEGIEVDDSALQSSAQRLGLMTRVLTTLDEQCRLGERASDEEFLQIVGNTIAHRVFKARAGGYLLHLPLRWEGLLCGGGLCDEEYGYYAGGDVEPITLV